MLNRSFYSIWHKKTLIKYSHLKYLHLKSDSLHHLISKIQLYFYINIITPLEFLLSILIKILLHFLFILLFFHPHFLFYHLPFFILLHSTAVKDVQEGQQVLVNLLLILIQMLVILLVYLQEVQRLSSRIQERKFLL